MYECVFHLEVYICKCGKKTRPVEIHSTYWQQRAGRLGSGRPHQSQAAGQKTSPQGSHMPSTEVDCQESTGAAPLRPERHRARHRALSPPYQTTLPHPAAWAKPGNWSSQRGQGPTLGQ
ncbi:hypothetical protein ILYODFUR_031911 [Ilyodon furcidens]|uniref:Uncharacterized protein n=1 Tax=Ilyodon furcidens TaxID=33524 RepID=A0ABV0TZF2_9TELE